MKIKFLSKDDMKLLKRAFAYVKPYKLKLLLFFICISSSIIFGLIDPYIYGVLIASLPQGNVYILAKCMVLLSIIYLLQLVIMHFYSYIETYLNNNIVKDLKCDMYDKILNLPVKAFDETPVGEFISRLHNDAEALSSIITFQVVNAIMDILKAIVIGFAVFKINVRLALIVIACFPFSYYIFVKYGKKLKKKNMELKNIADDYFSSVEQSFQGIREVKCLGIKKHNFIQFNNISNDFKQKGIEMALINIVAHDLAGFINIISSVLVMSIGGYFVINKILPLELFIAFSSYSKQFSCSLMNITKMNATIQQAITSLERIFGIMDNLSYSNECFGEKSIMEIEGNIQFTNVSFSYGEDGEVLKDINFQVMGNKKLAIVGKSGAGKSTILNLLLRLYDCDYGDITIDNIDVNEFDEKSLRSHISVIRQDPFLFNISIMENIKIANPNATEEEVYDACRSAYIHDFIMSLPSKYDSIVGENGVNLSGGQRQRIAIARGLIKKSKIILFDEATSALDNESQYFIKQSLNLISKKHTIIIIAHRLSTIIDADEIVVIDSGRIVGQGSHSDLIKDNVIYKNLYEADMEILNIPQEVG
ncbi:ABC transporter ATP-binding protein [Clostridium sp. UBA6640]|uniref:ABC transporter ATP-binding protein n=1 Tax=Clostridium sp. UBA6640 TaxID=1946370 RepID=UPI0025C229A2|nr:ABC transporter ATP-binding protein [Clostridium sp. UBA6640]